MVAGCLQPSSASTSHLGHAKPGTATLMHTTPRALPSPAAGTEEGAGGIAAAAAAAAAAVACTQGGEAARGVGGRLVEAAVQAQALHRAAVFI